MIEEVAGSDRSPDPHDSQRAQVGKAQPFYESEMALFYECIQKCVRKLLDTADIVKDRDFSTIDETRLVWLVWIASGLPTTRPQCRETPEAHLGGAASCWTVIRAKTFMTVESLSLPES